MQHPESHWPIEEPEHLTDALLEQGATPEELDDLLPAVLRLSEWQAPGRSRTDTQLLLAKLARALPAPSPVREAIQTNRRRQGAGLRWLLATAQHASQTLRPGFLAGERAGTVIGAMVVSASATRRPHKS